MLNNTLDNVFTLVNWFGCRYIKPFRITYIFPCKLFNVCWFESMEIRMKNKLHLMQLYSKSSISELFQHVQFHVEQYYIFQKSCTLRNTSYIFWCWKTFRTLELKGINEKLTWCFTVANCLLSLKKMEMGGLNNFIFMYV